MLLISGIVIGAALLYSLYHRNYISTKLSKLKSVAKGYKERDPSQSWFMSYGKALVLIFKCKCIDIYNSFTSINTKRFTFVKYIQGGNVCLAIIPNKNGPKPHLEYGYIDDVRVDELIKILSGSNRDFSGQKNALFEFGNTIRYKFSDEDEVNMINPSGSENSKKSENLKKIKKLVWVS